MGVSTDAIIAFGFDLGEDKPECMEEYDDFEDFIAHAEGWADPSPSGSPEWDAWYKTHEPEMKAAWEEKRKIVAACPVEIIYHCSCEWAMFVVAIRGTETRAWRGSPRELGTAETVLRVDPARVERAKAWCEKVGIPWSEPKWLLFSMWG